MILAHFIKRELETILYVPIFSPSTLRPLPCTLPFSPSGAVLIEHGPQRPSLLEIDYALHLRFPQQRALLVSRGALPRHRAVRAVVWEPQAALHNAGRPPLPQHLCGYLGRARAHELFCPLDTDEPPPQRHPYARHSERSIVCQSQLPELYDRDCGVDCCLAYDGRFLVCVDFLRPFLPSFPPTQQISLRCSPPSHLSMNSF